MGPIYSVIVYEIIYAIKRQKKEQLKKWNIVRKG